MQQIPLTQGYVALVSDEDFEALSRYRWCAMRVRGGRVYQIATRRNIGAYIPGDHGGAWRFTDADLGLMQLLRGTRVRFGEPQTALKQEA